MVLNYFMSCAITTSSDDDNIHCFKPRQSCEGGGSWLADEVKIYPVLLIMMILSHLLLILMKKKSSKLNFG